MAVVKSQARTEHIQQESRKESPDEFPVEKETENNKTKSSWGKKPRRIAQQPCSHINPAGEDCISFQKARQNTNLTLQIIGTVS